MRNYFQAPESIEARRAGTQSIPSRRRQRRAPIGHALVFRLKVLVEFEKLAALLKFSSSVAA